MIFYLDLQNNCFDIYIFVVLQNISCYDIDMHCRAPEMVWYDVDIFVVLQNMLSDIDVLVRLQDVSAILLIHTSTAEMILLRVFKEPFSL